MSRKLSLADFLTPCRRSFVRLSIYNTLWLSAGQAMSYATLGRAAWGEYGEAYAATEDGRRAVTQAVMVLRQRLAETQRPDAPKIERVYGVGYRMVGDRARWWGPMTTAKPVARQRSKTCKHGHIKEYRWERWVCMTCKAQHDRTRNQTQAVPS